MGVVEGIFSGPMEGLPAGFSLPKQSVNSASLTKLGIPSDSNLYRFKKKKGDPDMAILLLTTAELDELNALGFFLQPGDLAQPPVQLTLCPGPKDKVELLEPFWLLC